MRLGGAVIVVLGVAIIGCRTAPSSSAPPSSTSPATDPAAKSSESGTIDVSVIDGVPETVALRMVDAALSHQPTAAVHAGQQFEVIEVSAVHGESFEEEGDYVRVVVEFIDPVPPEHWPDEPVCLIGRASDDITGIAWLLSSETQTVAAYSPQWDRAIDCVPD